VRRSSLRPLRCSENTVALRKGIALATSFTNFSLLPKPVKAPAAIGQDVRLPRFYFPGTGLHYESCFSLIAPISFFTAIMALSISI
jgi:hypothetical protein